MEDRTRLAFDFLRARNGGIVTVSEIAAASGWSESTVKTYIAKHWGPWLRRVQPGVFRVQAFDAVSYGSFLARQSQVKADPTTPPALQARIALALRTGESQDAEFKIDIPKSRDDLAHEIAAFATSNDGLILLGVDDGGSVRGLVGAETAGGWAAIREVVEGIVNKVRPRMGTSITRVPWDDQWLVAIEVTRGPEPVYYVNGKPYLRSGTHSRPAEPDEVKRFVTDAAGLRASAVEDSLQRIERLLDGST